jgi:predicted NAD-dependent protein-ADP-ribosyltransferase YbiA (DUF1768 family)
MAASKLDDSIYYYHHEKVFEEDLGYPSSLYDLTINDTDISVAIGRPKLTHIQKNILFFPIYVLLYNEDKDTYTNHGQIGVFEIRARGADITKYTDEDYELDEEKLGTPILFGFAKQADFLKKYSAAAAPAADEDSTSGAMEMEKPSPAAAAAAAAAEAEPEIDDMFDIKPLENAATTAVPADDPTIYKIPDMSIIFRPVEDARVLPDLTEETVLDTKKYRKEYEQNSSTTWVEKFFKNNFYTIEENPANGDCFFYVVRDAFRQFGLETTVEKLREIVATAATQDTFDTYSALYNGTKTTLREATEIMKKLKKINDDFKKKIDTAASKDEIDIFMEKAQKNKAEFDEQKDIAKTARANLQEFEFMEGVDNLEKLRLVMRTSKYWADDFAISALEKALRVKMIILAESAFREGALDMVLECGQKIEGFRPVFYIITSYSGNHYRLISYKAKRILRFKEIPHALKVLIMNKCMENLGSAYGVIPEFRELKQHYNINDGDDIDADLTAAATASTPAADLYDRETIFRFFAQSANKKPGRGAGEVVAAADAEIYRFLETVPDWRRKLDNSYVGDDAVFELDGKRWAAPEIYLQAAKFRQQNPDFYATFSIDADTAHSRDPEMARVAGSMEGHGDVKAADGAVKHMVLRSKTIKIDPGYFGAEADYEREAVRAKFEQNAPLRRILAATRRALLMHYVSRTNAKPAIILMETRAELGRD